MVSLGRNNLESSPMVCHLVLSLHGMRPSVGPREMPPCACPLRNPRELKPQGCWRDARPSKGVASTSRSTRGFYNIYLHDRSARSSQSDQLVPFGACTIHQVSLLSFLPLVQLRCSLQPSPWVTPSSSLSQPQAALSSVVTYGRRVSLFFPPLFLFVFSTPLPPFF